MSDRADFIISEDALIALVSAIRAADETFMSGQTGGGGTRHYVRDCLLPEFEERGFRLLLNPEPPLVSFESHPTAQSQKEPDATDS
jgi:hypothetical protein